MTLYSPIIGLLRTIILFSNNSTIGSFSACHSYESIIRGHYAIICYMIHTKKRHPTGLSSVIMVYLRKKIPLLALRPGFTLLCRTQENVDKKDKAGFIF